jgi:hypothetical protein
VGIVVGIVVGIAVGIVVGVVVGIVVDIVVEIGVERPEQLSLVCTSNINAIVHSACFGSCE